MTIQMYIADEKRAARKDAERRIIVRMYRRGKPLEDIAQDTDMPVDAVRDILKAEGLVN